MGTPEFPDLGKHCSVEDCKLIDFLPFTCDRCIQVFCLEHRSYIKHKCPKGDKNDLTVVICPLCAKGVRLNPDQDPNITWEIHANTDCDPSNYEKATKKKKCSVVGCKDILTFSNTVKCRDCTIDHCLKHRFGADHKCPGPKKPDPGFQFMDFFNTGKKEKEKSKWATSFYSVVSSLKESAEANMEKLSSDFSQVFQKENGEKVQENAGNRGKKVVLDVCPKCSKGFLDSSSLVQHVEKDHRGDSKA